MTTPQADEELAYVRASMGSDLDTLLVFNLLRTHSYLGPFLEARLRDEHLTGAQLNALLVLREAQPEGLLMGQLGQRLIVTRSNVTGLVDRLERQGLAQRVETPDRRATAVRLTEAGEALVEHVAPRHAEWLSEITGCLNEAEKKTLIQLLTKLRRELRSRRRKENLP